MEPLLLGVCDAPCREVHVSPYDNKVGGYSDLYPLCHLLSSPRCRVCNTELVLLVQVYCPLIGSTYHRTLYVYCCTRQSCGTNSWLVLRSQMKEKEATEKSQQSLFKDVDWCKDATDWSGSGDDSACDRDITLSTAQSMLPSDNSVTEVARGVEGLTLATAVPFSSAPYYPSFYVNVVDSSVYATVEPPRGQCKAQCTYSDGEGYEKGTAKHGDHMFQKFHKAISNCPGQIIRYQRGGNPLLITDNPQYAPKTYHCKQCGSLCVFEFQVLPQLIYILQSAIREQLHGDPYCEVVEYGTVLVYTCSKCCWSDSSNMIEEVVVVQPDLDNSLISAI